MWAILATAAAIWLSVFVTLQSGAGAEIKSVASTLMQNFDETIDSVTTKPSKPSKRNVIFMVSDGMGPASLSMTRSFQQFVADLHPLSTLNIDKLFIGNSRTRSSDSLVTDSAAGATAFSCGLKTYNGAIGVNPQGEPCATVLEAAKLMGYKTGMVVTTRITDATPASFASHAHDRSEEDFIADQLIGSAHPFGRMCDLLIGGGRCHFEPKSVHGGCRSDSRNLIEEAKSSGWTYVDSLVDRSGLSAEDLPLLALLDPHDIPFDIDRKDSVYPSLHDSAVFALETLANATADSEQGFFLMIEGSRIDHAGHANDPLAQVHEVLAYDKTMAAVVDFINNSKVPTVMVSTSDHETGGLSVARQVTKEYPDYLWLPSVLANASHSSEHLAKELRHKNHKSSHALKAYVADKVLGPEGLNFDDIASKDIEKVAKHHHDAQDILAKMISHRAQIGWATHGHSAVDVNVYGYSKDFQTLRALYGDNENIEIGMFLSDHIGANLTSLTAELRNGFGDDFEKDATAVDHEYEYEVMHSEQLL